MGHNVKLVALVTLVLQNSALILVMKQSRTASSEPYSTTTAVVMAELLKLVVACACVYREAEFSPTKFADTVSAYILSDLPTFGKLMVPALLYTVQNNLQYVAVSNLHAAVFQVLSQMKLLTTALLSVIMLRKVLTGMQWLALTLLALGVAVVQLAQLDPARADQGTTNMLGFVAVLVSALTSAGAGVYLEKVIKGTKGSIWIRNMQMAAIGICLGLLACRMREPEWESIITKGFFSGYTPLVWTVIFLQAFGGLVVALVVKHADNVLKGLATSISIILSCIVSMELFGFEITAQFCAGAALVVSAVVIYARNAPSAPTASGKGPTGGDTVATIPAASKTAPAV